MSKSLEKNTDFTGDFEFMRHQRYPIDFKDACLLNQPHPCNNALLTLLVRHIRPQDVHYQWWTLINTLYGASVQAGRTLTMNGPVSDIQIRASLA